MMSIAEKAAKGMKLDDVLIIDAHNHIGDWKAFHAPVNSAEGMLASMNTLSIDKCFITAHVSSGPDYVFGNDIVIDTLKKYPDRFIGYVTLNPNYEENMKNELDRCFKVNGIKGIKINPASHGNPPIDDKRYRIAYEYADEINCPILIHVWGDSSVSAVEKLSEQYPSAIFIMGHAGGEIRAMEYALNVINNRKNVYADLAISLAYEGNVEWFVKESGSKKILFGTDMPFFDPRPIFGRLAMANISDDEKKDIFGLNIAGILKL